MVLSRHLSNASLAIADDAQRLSSHFLSAPPRGWLRPGTTCNRVDLTPRRVKGTSRGDSAGADSGTLDFGLSIFNTDMIDRR